MDFEWIEKSIYKTTGELEEHLNGKALKNETSLKKWVLLPKLWTLFV